jgi:hypothetical protein
MHLGIGLHNPHIGIRRIGLRNPRRSFDRKRRRLADGLDRLVVDSERRSNPFSAAVPIQRRAILACREQLIELADDLRATNEPVSEKGIELVHNLLCDASSPVYAPLGEDMLRDTLRHAHATLLLR